MVTRVIVGILIVIIVALIIWAIVSSTMRSSSRSRRQMEITDREENFMNHEGKPFALVYLRMNGCKFCERFDPVWKQLNSDHSEDLSDMGVYLKDVESKSAEAQRLDADSFPTIVLTRDGEKIATFQDTRSVPALLGFVRANVVK